jgi:hypothetical protein
MEREPQLWQMTRWKLQRDRSNGSFLDIKTTLQPSSIKTREDVVTNASTNSGIPE